MGRELMEVMENWKGYVSPHRRGRPADWNSRLASLNDLLENHGGLSMRARAFALEEVLTTDDFPYLFGDTIDRQMLQAYKDTPQVCQRICRPGTVPDFRDVKRFRMDGANCRLQKVVEKGEYLAATIDETKYSYSVDKWGRQIDISWETMINDDLGAFNDIFTRLGQATRKTQEYFITSLFFNAAGALDAYFAAAGGAGAVATGAASALDIGSLEGAVEAMQSYLDNCDEPLLNRPKYLMVPPALEFTARQILTSSEKMWIADHADAGGAFAPAAYPTTNVIASYGLELIINPWIPVVVTTGTLGATSWALFSDPANLAAAEFGTLRGHPNPELRMKASDSMRAGGGAMSPFDGDFATDDVLWRVRSVFGGTTLDPRAGWASDGQ